MNPALSLVRFCNGSAPNVLDWNVYELPVPRCSFLRSRRYFPEDRPRPEARRFFGIIFCRLRGAFWEGTPSEAIPEHLKYSPGHLRGVRARFLILFAAFRAHVGAHFGSIFGLFILLLWLIFPQRLSGGIFVNFGPECSPKGGFAGRLMCFPCSKY